MPLFGQYANFKEEYSDNGGPMFKLGQILALLILLSSCSGGGIGNYVDQLSFGQWGKTFFSDPQQVSLKEIHLDTGNLLGRTIIVEGTLVEVGKHHTHIVVSDSTARMLVVLTKMRSPEKQIGESTSESISILGTVERGKKGLPYIAAIAVRKINTKASS